MQAIQSEPESETRDHTCDNVLLCKDADVKEEPVNDSSFSDLTDPGGKTTASPLGTFEFHAVKFEENPDPTSRLVELAPPDLGTAREVKDESDIYDPYLAQDSLDSPPETAQTSSPNHKSLVDIIIPTDCVEVKPEANRSKRTSSQQSPRSALNSELSQAHRPGTSTHKKSPSTTRQDPDSRARRKRQRSADTERKLGDAAQAKLELVEMKMAIARNRLKRLKNGTSIEEAEANLRRTEHEIKLQTLKSRYKREVEKEKLRAKISKIDMEIQKCILMKKRPERNGDDR